MTKNLPYLDPSGRLPARGCGQCTGLRYGVEDRKIGPERPGWRGFVKNDDAWYSFTPLDVG